MLKNESPVVVLAVTVVERLLWAAIAIVAPVALYVFIQLTLGPYFFGPFFRLILFNLNDALNIDWLPWVFVLYVLLVATIGPSLRHWYRDRSYRTARWNMGPRERYPRIPDAEE